MRRTLLWTAGLAGLGVGYAVARSAFYARRRISLDGRVAIVTGGSRGLGLLIARELLWRGARVAICARSADELDEARRWLGGGSDLITIACDVGDGDAVGRMVAAVGDRLGPVDVLVNSAAGPSGSIDCARAVLPSMRRRAFGRICNLIAAGGEPAETGYSEALAAELAGSGVIVTTVVPGLIQAGSRVALPLLSTDAERAASEVADAIEEGRSRRVLTLAARFPVLARAVEARRSAPSLAGGFESRAE